MDIQLLILDLDGTIVGRSNQINQTVKDTIKQVQNKGIQVVIATGRMYQSAKMYHEYLDLKTPIIAYNGAWMQNPSTGEVFKYLPVSPDIAKELIDYYEQSHLLTQVDVHFYHDDQLYVRQVTSETALYAQRSSIVPKSVGDLRSLADFSPTKVLAFSSDAKLMQKTTQELQQLFPRERVYIIQSDTTLIEANHPQATKGQTTRYLAEEILGLSSSQVMAIGDNFNDLDLLQYAGMGVAMGNAHSTVQGVAQWVAPTVEEDGAAVAIRQFLL